jgi:hypothetical protein
MKKIFFLILLAFLFTAGSNLTYSQTGNNVLLEYVTGTWCPWCPCGETIIQGILQNYPNTVVLGYHGYNNTSDPWWTYSSGIRALLTDPFYPGGVVGRKTGFLDRSGWNNQVVIQSLTLQPGVSINITSKNYNSSTRVLTATVVTTALTNLTGSYNINFVLTEGNLVYSQTGNGTCPGSGTWVHSWVVKSMINGDIGQVITTSPWNQGVQFTTNLNYTIPSGFVDNNCTLNTFVYKVGTVYNSDCNIQQTSVQSVTAPLGINHNNNNVPDKYLLSQNYPNPFNPTTNIKFEIPKDGNISLKIYDITGAVVQTFVDGFIKAGTYNAEVDASNLASGVYFYTLKAADFFQTKKMILVK